MCLANSFAQTQCTVVWASQNGGVTGGGTASATVVTNYTDLKAAITSSSVKVQDLLSSMRKIPKKLICL